MTRPTARTLVLTDGGALDYSTALASYTAPAPLLPVFTGLPTILSDGTPQVGEPLTGVDTGVTNLGVGLLTRRWLLGTTVLSTSASYTPSQPGVFTFQNRVVDGSGNALVTTSATVTVQAAPATLGTLLLAASSITENAPSGTVVGGILGKTAGSILTMADSAGGRFAIVSGGLVAGATATDYETATSHTIAIDETLTGATNSPKRNYFVISVANVLEQPALGALSLSSLSYTIGTPASGAIAGATAGSTITAAGLPAGLAINGPSRTWAYDGSGSAGATDITLTETLGDSPNSPRQSAVRVTIAAADAPAAAAEFTADRALHMMALDTPVGATLWTVSGASEAPSISPNDGRFAVGAATAPGEYPIIRGAGAVAPAFVTVQVSAGGKTLPMPVMIADRRSPRTKYRDLIPVAQQQWFTDLLIAVMNDANDHPHIGPFTDNAVKDGDWHDPTTWDTGRVPDGIAPATKRVWNPETLAFEDHVCGTSVVNTGNFNIRISRSCSFKDAHVGMLGSLTVRPKVGEDIAVTADTIVCHGGFYHDHDAAFSKTFGGRRIDFIWVAHEAPGKTARCGLLMMGPRRRSGLFKAQRLFSPVQVEQGATTVHLEGLADANWQVGDWLVWPSTRAPVLATNDPSYLGPREYVGQGWEPRSGTHDNVGVGLQPTPDYGGLWNISTHQYVRITALDLTAGTVTFAGQPLTEEHSFITRTLPRGQTVEIKPEVVNVTRSVRYRSADPTTLQTRAHVMGMAWGEAQSLFGESLYMGRSAIDPSLASPSGTILYDTHGNQVTDPNNVIARYAEHEHFTGALFCDKVPVSINWAIHNPPVAGRPEFLGRSQGMVTHGGRHHIQGLVVVGERSAGWKSENGNENSELIDCTVIGATGDGFIQGYGDRATTLWKHNAHTGAGYENQSRVLYARDCHAYGCNHAWLAVQQTVLGMNTTFKNLDLVTADRMAMPSSDPLSCHPDEGPEHYAQNNVQMHHLEGLLNVGCRVGFRIYGRESLDRDDQTPAVFRRCHSLNTSLPFHSDDYVNNYNMLDCAWLNLERQGQEAFHTGGGWNQTFNFANMLLEGFAIGFTLQTGQLNFDGFWIDVDFVNVGTQFIQALYDGSKLGPRKDGTPRAVADPRDSVYYGVWGIPYAEDGTPWPTSWGPNGIYIRKLEVIRSADLPQQFPKQGPNVHPHDAMYLPDPGFAYGGVDPRPADQQGAPGFWLHPASVTTVAYDGDPHTVRLSGAWRDSVGTRTWGYWSSFEGGQEEGIAVALPFRLLSIPPAQLIRENGCCVDQGTPAGAVKVRIWLNQWDRSTGEPYHGHFDITVTGVPDAVRDANLVDPALTAQDISGRAELPSLGPIVETRLGAPVITVPIPATLYLAPTNHLAQPLKSDSAWTMWKLTGPDAGKLEITLIGGVKTLRYVGDVVPGVAATYAVTITATNPFSGALWSQDVTVEVSEDYFETLFTDYTGDLASHPQLQALAPIIASPASGFYFSNGDGTSRTAGPGGNQMGYFHETHSPGHMVEVDMATGSGGVDFCLILETTPNSFVYVQGMAGTGAICTVWEAANLGTGAQNVHKLAEANLGQDTMRFFVLPDPTDPNGVGSVCMADGSGKQYFGAYLSTPVTGTKGGFGWFPWAGNGSGAAFNPQYRRLKIAPYAG